MLPNAIVSGTQSIFSYKGYCGETWREGGEHRVRVVGVKDSLNATCAKAAEVQVEFEDLVDNYLAVCSSIGKVPDVGSP